MGSRTDSIIFGPYTNKGPWGSGEFWSGTLVGDTAVIEFHTRPDENGKGFEIFEVSHIFPKLDLRLRSDQPDVLNCELDASCYGEIQKNAVARITYNDNGPFVCTGTLLNDSAQDQIPYFLTANHCVATQTVAQTVEVYWFYQTTSCNSGVLRTDWVQQFGGANLLATQSSNDFSLLRLVNNAPAGAWFSEMDERHPINRHCRFRASSPRRGSSPQPSIHTYVGPVALSRVRTPVAKYSRVG